MIAFENTEGEEYDSSVSVSASVKEGKTLITIANISCSEDAEILLEGVGMAIPQTAEATILYTEDMHAHNTFEEPNAVVPQELVLDPTKPIRIPKAGILAITFCAE